MKGERELNTRGERGVLRHDAHFLKEGGRLLFLHSTLVLTDGDGRRGEERRGVGIRLGMVGWGSSVCSGPHNLVGERRPGVARVKGLS